MNGGNDYDEYHCFIRIPDSFHGMEETKLVQDTFNKIRKILGMDEIKI